MLLAVFAVHAQGLNYSPAQYLFLVVLTLLVSIRTVGVPGTATITATSLFAAAGLPIPFIAISQPISQIVDMGRTALNVAGAANTAVIVAQTEHQLDADLYYGRKEYSDELDVDGSDAGPAPTPTTAPAVPPRLPNAVLLASGGDACCGIRPGK